MDNDPMASESIALMHQRPMMHQQSDRTTSWGLSRLLEQLQKVYEEVANKNA